MTLEHQYRTRREMRRLFGKRAYWQQLGRSWVLAERMGNKAWTAYYELFGHVVR